MSGVSWSLSCNGIHFKSFSCWTERGTCRRFHLSFVVPVGGDRALPCRRCRTILIGRCVQWTLRTFSADHIKRFNFRHVLFISLVSLIDRGSSFHKFYKEGDQMVSVFWRNRLLLHGRIVQQFHEKGETLHGHARQPTAWREEFGRTRQPNVALAGSWVVRQRWLRFYVDCLLLECNNLDLSAQCQVKHELRLSCCTVHLAFIVKVLERSGCNLLWVSGILLPPSLIFTLSYLQTQFILSTFSPLSLIYFTPKFV